MAHVGEELRLVLACLLKLAALVLDFVEQPHVLDGDRGLIGEGRDQLDLLVGERLYFRARQGEHADRNTLAEHWDAESCAVISQPLCFDQGVLWISPYVGNMNYSTFNQRAPCCRSSLALDGSTPDVVQELAGIAVGLRVVEKPIFLADNCGLVGSAEPGSGFNKGLQHGLQIESRAADDLEHVGSSGLLL